MDLNLDVNYATNLSVGSHHGPTTTTGAQGPHGPTFPDNVVSLGALKINFKYTNNADTPMLPKPDENASTEKPQQWGEAYSPVYEQNYYQSLSEHLKDANLTQNQESAVTFAILTGKPIPDDTFLNDLVQDLQGKVEGDMIEMFGEDSFPSLRELAKAVKSNGKSTVESATEQLKELEQHANSLPEGAEKKKLLQFIKEAKGNFDKLQNAFDAVDNAGSRQELGAVLNNINQQAKNFQTQISNAVLKDPYIGSVLSKVQEGLYTELGNFSNQINHALGSNQLAQGNWNLINSEVGHTFLKVLGLNYDASFKQALESSGLSEDEQASVLFARHNPTLVTDPTVKKQLDQINQVALSKMSPSWGIPKEYVPPPANSNKFNAEVELTADQAFAKQLAGTDLSALSSQLRMKESYVAGIVEYIRYNPAVAQEALNNPEKMKQMFGIYDRTHLEAVMKMVATVEKGALQTVKGLPEGFKPSPGSVNYNAKLAGRFSLQFDQNLNNQEPPLSFEQIAAVRAALADPLASGITKETKTLIGKIFNQTVSDIQNELKLPLGWLPPVSSIRLTETAPAHIKAAISGIEQIEDFLKIAAKYIDGYADDPSKASLLNALKIISEALAKLKDQIAQLMAIDSEIAHKLTEAQKEAALYKIELQKTNIEKVKEQREELSGLQKALEWLGPIGKVFGMITLCIVAGPVGVVLAASMIQEMATDGKENFMTTMFEQMNEDLGPEAGIAISSILCLAMTCCGANIAGIQVFFENARVIQEIGKLAGDEQGGELAAMILQIAVEIAIAVATAVATFGTSSAASVARLKAQVCSGLARDFTRLSSVAVRMGQRGERLAEKLLTWADKLGDMADNFYDLGKSAEKLTNQVLKYKKLLKQAEDGGDKAEILKANDKLKLVQNQLDEVNGKISNVTSETIVTAGEVTETVANSTASIIQGSISIIQSEFTELFAQIDADIEMLENLIKILKKTMQVILDGMSGQGQWMIEIGNIQSKMWSDRTQTASLVAGANEA